MSRRRVEKQTCPECGADRYVQPFECDHCMKRVTVPLEEEKGVSTLEPAGWITVYERAGVDPWPRYTGDDHTTIQPRLYCSWVCVEQALPTLRQRSEENQAMAR